MTKLENKILRAIKATPGINWSQLASLLKRKESALTKALANLHALGYIGYLKTRCYLNRQVISVYRKGVDACVREQWEAGKMVLDKEVLVEDIWLQNYLTPRQLSKYIPCVEGDNSYSYNYGIDTSSAVLFERTNSVCFDFERFEYILNQWMATS